MHRRTLIAALACLGLATAATAHDPRTDKSTVSTRLEIDGHGALELSYTPLHYNAERFQDAKNQERFMTFLNSVVWGNLGTATFEFRARFDDIVIQPGIYQLGINMTRDDNFPLVFRQTDAGGDVEQSMVIPFETTALASPVEYLCYSIQLTDEHDRFVIEYRRRIAGQQTPRSTAGVSNACSSPPR